MSSSDESFLVCLPVAGTNLVVPGSMKKQCSACATPVWVSPASWKLCEEKQLPLLCLPCAERRAALDDDVQTQLPTAEQVQEAVQAIKKNIIERN